MLLATETAVRAAFVITEPYLTFNWPLKNTGEMKLLHREGMEVSTGNLIFITTTWLPVHRTPLPCTLPNRQPYKGLHDVKVISCGLLFKVGSVGFGRSKKFVIG